MQKEVIEVDSLEDVAVRVGQRLADEDHPVKAHEFMPLIEVELVRGGYNHEEIQVFKSDVARQVNAWRRKISTGNSRSR